MKPLTPLKFYRKGNRPIYGVHTYTTGCCRFTLMRTGFVFDESKRGTSGNHQWMICASSIGPQSHEWYEWLEEVGLDTVLFPTRTAALEALVDTVVACDLLTAQTPDISNSGDVAC